MAWRQTGLSVMRRDGLQSRGWEGLSDGRLVWLAGRADAARKRAG